ncbi:MAG: hypothetical protein NXH75_06830 [Halobacteriovoraceae bacterium]|nr:hypothetical protein [Halobacteriovoraceae bacterium]
MKWTARNKDWNPLERKTYRYKKPAMQFFCPLCRTERSITIHHKLTPLNYAQMILITGLITVLSFPWGGFKTLAVFFPVWMAFEVIRRHLFSREVPCPHCGFDASWYKRDVKVARRRVAEFWETQQSKVPDTASDETVISAP